MFVNVCWLATGDEGYMDSWVAEVSIVHPHGDIIRQYLKLKSLQLDILTAKQQYLKEKAALLDLDDGQSVTALPLQRACGVCWGAHS